MAVYLPYAVINNTEIAYNMPLKRELTSEFESKIINTSYGVLSTKKTLNFMYNIHYFYHFNKFDNFETFPIPAIVHVVR